MGFESAGALWGMLTLPTGSPVDVVVSSYGGRRCRPGIVIHHTAPLAPGDTTRRHNIPATSPARTRRDLGFDSEPTRSHLERVFLKLVGRAISRLRR